MVEQRLQQRLRLLVVPPAVLIIVISLSALLTGAVPGIQPRETVFDVLGRVEPREAPATRGIAIIDIGEDSLDALGPWPWPRTALARLVDAARGAGATAVVITVPVDGEDPLSPEALSTFIDITTDSAPLLESLQRLPRNDVALAAAVSQLPSALGIGPTSARAAIWERANLAAATWQGGEIDPDASRFVALPLLPGVRTVDPVLPESGQLAAITVMADADGRVRRVPLLWNVGGIPVPSAALTPLTLSTTPPSVITSASARRAGAVLPSALVVSSGAIPLDSSGSVRAWMPADIALPTVPAWRVLEGADTWTGPLSGRVVFIGESISPRAMIDTQRGEMSLAQFHALTAEQLAMGAVLSRPGWIVTTEAILAFVFGALTLGAAIYLRPIYSVLIASGATVLAVAGSWLAFEQAAFLFDPLPVIATSIGAPLAILFVVVGNMLFRDDALRSAFHGALPAAAMNKLQTVGAGRLLRGVRREVTVLSCGLKLPPSVLARYEGRPDDFIRFTAAANDALRKTILAHDGTVDYGEDGRLLGYWNVPETIEHPVEKACACALKMIDDMNALSDDVQTAAYSAGGRDADMDAGFAEGSIEIGLASSECFAGPVGRGSRNRYAVIGQAVRLASALRQRARQYGPAIIADDAVFDALRHHYAFLDLDAIRTAPDAPTTTVYGLVGNPFLKASKSFRQLADIQRELVVSWRSGDLSKTTVALQRLRGVPGVPEVYIDLFEGRLERARAAAATTGSLAEVVTL